MIKWQSGRQGTGYEKLKLLCFEPYVDAWLLRYRPDAHIPPHRDPVDGRKHYRLNIVLSKAVGGKFHTQEYIFNLWERVILFRPDENTHYVSKIVSGTRYVLSIGVAFNE
jgi:hypothetical protein